MIATFMVRDRRTGRTYEAYEQQGWCDVRGIRTIVVVEGANETTYAMKAFKKKFIARNVIEEPTAA